MSKKFTPTKEQICAAQNLLVAMTVQQSVEPIVTGYQRDILQKNQWRICPTMARRGIEREVITDPNLVYLLADADAKKYFALCDQAKMASGLMVSKPENCPLLEAKSQVIDAQRALIESMQSVTGVTWDLLMRNFSEKPRYVELTLKVLAPFVGDADQILKGIVNG